jgi:hypothetical protein
MDKLSQAAKLYLSDYKILKTVNIELDNFFNKLAENIHDNIQNDLIEPIKDKYTKLEISSNDIPTGYFEVRFLKKFENKDYPDGKIYICYNDPRFLDESDRSDIIEVGICTNDTRKRFEKDVKKLDNELFEIKTFEIDLDSSENTIDKICEFIAEKFYQIDKVFDKINDIK